MRMHRDQSTLLLIDLQTRLAPAIAEGEDVLAASVWLTQLAQRLGVPVICTEQYPRGLGPTLPALRERLDASSMVEKIHFSAVTEGAVFDCPGGANRQFVVAGTESHVCVLQTVLDLRTQGRDVFVVADAVGSRHVGDKELALARMRQAGANIVSREMVAFEWLAQAGTDEFREISRTLIR